jgi:hypothetical protein
MLCLGFALVLAACQPERQTEHELPPLPHETLEVECRKIGGAVSTVSGGLLACLRETGDSGKQCSRESDCEGQCLARSGTCAPVDPLFGCHEILGDTGTRMTQCRD